jgi:hypothetical protein
MEGSVLSFLRMKGERHSHVSGLLLKIFSIWHAHALGSGMDSKNNKNPSPRQFGIKTNRHHIFFQTNVKCNQNILDLNIL